jgi:hypothetical protein
VTGIAWHLLGVRKTEEKQTRRLSRVVPLKGGLLMSVAFFRPPNHRVPEGSVGADPTSASPVEVFRSVSATLSDSNNFRARRNRAPPSPLPLLVRRLRCFLLVSDDPPSTSLHVTLSFSSPPFFLPIHLFTG